MSRTIHRQIGCTDRMVPSAGFAPRAGEIALVTPLPFAQMRIGELDETDHRCLCPRNERFKHMRDGRAG